jgi:hypothetical protein
LSKTITSKGRVFWTFVNGQNGKVIIDLKDKQPAIIEFLLLEGYPGGEIAIRFRNVWGSAACSRASVFRWINEVRHGNEELRNKGHPGRRYR